jgi:23S rRNA pseudouridine1911/1915/1917 synthase
MSDAPLSLQVPAKLAGQRFDRALAELIPGTSGARLQKLVRLGRVKLDGKRVLRSNFRVKGGEHVLVLFEAEPAPAPPPELTWLEVAERFAVVSKPDGMLAHPADRAHGPSVSEQATAKLGRLPSTDDAHRPGIVHRLDRETSGVMILARDAEAMDDLRDQFRARTVKKTYLALAVGEPPSESFDVDRSLAQDPHQLDLQRVDPKGREAFSSFTVLESFRSPELGPVHWIECRPKTGRRHQLRVHLAHAGCYLIADKLYRPPGQSQPHKQLKHQALHAAELELAPPGVAGRQTFTAPVRADLAAFLERLRATP